MADASVASPWWVVAVAAVPGAASGVWVFWRWWLERGDRRATEALTREQGQLRELDQQRTALGREHADLFDRMKAELVRTQSRLRELEAHADRGWDLARWWHRRAHQVRDAALEARALDPRRDPPWPDLPLPPLEDPAGRG